MTVDPKETEVEEVEPDEEEVEAEPEVKIDWKAMSRKHERSAKRLQKEREELQAKLKERESTDQSEHEKAVQAARAEGETTARTEAEKERRADRLEAATIRLAAKGMKIKDDDNADITVRFADAEDALTFVERSLRKGDLSEDELFDDRGRVDTSVLSEALTELIATKPHLADTGDNIGGKSRPRVAGSADGGKGSGGAKSKEDFSVAEHFERIRKKSAA